MTANRRVISGVIQRMRTAPFPTTCPIQFPLKRLTIALHYEPTLISSRQLPYQRRNFGLKSGVGGTTNSEGERGALWSRDEMGGNGEEVSPPYIIGGLRENIVSSPSMGSEVKPRPKSILS